jgi:hypothetical protein
MSDSLYVGISRRKKSSVNPYAMEHSAITILLAKVP